METAAGSGNTKARVSFRDIRDPELLSEFEAEATARRLRQLENKPLSGRFDARHFRRSPTTYFRMCTNGPETSGL
jgi:hypothetical protein